MLLMVIFQYVFFITCCDLSGIYQSRTSGCTSWVRLADNVYTAAGSLLLCGDHFHDHFSGNHRFQLFFRQTDKEIRSRTGDSGQCPSDSRSPVWVFGIRFLLPIMHYGDSLWSWCRRSGCGTEQLCGTSLFLQAYELASLLLGCRGSGKSIYHGLLPWKRTWLEPGILQCIHDSDCDHGDPVYQPAALEIADG